MEERSALPSTELRYPGPARLPLEHSDVRKYIDDYFYDGLLQPVTFAEWKRLPPWTMAGIRHDPKEEAQSRFESLLASVRDQLSETKNHHDWLRFAIRWGELIAVRCRAIELNVPDPLAFAALQAAVDDRFGRWMRGPYKSIFSLVDPMPVMVHQILSVLASEVHLS